MPYKGLTTTTEMPGMSGSGGVGYEMSGYGGVGYEMMWIWAADS